MPKPTPQDHHTTQLATAITTELKLGLMMALPNNLHAMISRVIVDYFEKNGLRIDKNGKQS